MFDTLNIKTKQHAMSTFASIEVEKLVLHGSDFTSNDAVPKYYVDTAVGTAAARIDAMLEGSVPAFDTLIELKTLMDANQGDLGTALTTRVSELSAAIADEAGAARGFELELRDEIQSELVSRSDQYGELKSQIDQEMLDRESAVNDVTIAVEDEKLRAEARETIIEEQQLQQIVDNDERFSHIDTSVVNVGKSVTGLQELMQESLATKFDKAAGYATRGDGALQIDNDHYLYLGTNWRLRASQGGKRQRLEFEYSGDQATWDLAIPFIRGS